MATTPSWLDHIPALSDDPTQPSQIALRTYALALSLSLGPALIPFITTVLSGKTSSRTSFFALKRVLRRELGYDGFPFAITLSVAGGSALHRMWNTLDARASVHSNSLELPIPSSSSGPKEMRQDNETWRSGPEHRWKSIAHLVKERLRSVELTSEQRTFISNVIASSAGILLLQEGRQRASRMKRGHHTQTSPTLDLTLLLAVRALDSLVQSFIHAYSGEAHITHENLSVAEPKLIKDLLEKERKRRRRAFVRQLTTKADALLFWACSARCDLDNIFI
jgi:hypothetical protein